MLIVKKSLISLGLVARPRSIESGEVPRYFFTNTSEVAVDERTEYFL